MSVAEYGAFIIGVVLGGLISFLTYLFHKDGNDD